MSGDTPPNFESGDGQSEASDRPPAVTGSMDAGATCELAVASQASPVASTVQHCDPFLAGAIFGLLATTEADESPPREQGRSRSRSVRGDQGSDGEAGGSNDDTTKTKKRSEGVSSSLGAPQSTLGQKTNKNGIDETK